MSNHAVFIPVFVHLTHQSGESMYIPAEDIRRMSPHGDSGAKLHLVGNEQVLVKETPYNIQKCITQAYGDVYAEFTNVITKAAYELQMKLTPSSGMPGPGGVQ